MPEPEPVAKRLILQAPGTAEAPGTVVATGVPGFYWTSTGDFDFYGIYISRAPYGEANQVYKNKSLDGSSNSFDLLNTDALPDGLYRWKMEAFKGGKSLGYSENRYFRVQRDQPSAPGNPIPSQKLRAETTTETGGGNESVSKKITREDQTAQNRQDLYTYFDNLQNFKTKEEAYKSTANSLAGKSNDEIAWIVEAQIIPACAGLYSATEIQTPNAELERANALLAKAMQERLEAWKQFLAGVKRGKMAEVNAAAQRLKDPPTEKQYAIAISTFKSKNGIQ